MLSHLAMNGWVSCTLMCWVDTCSLCRDWQPCTSVLIMPLPQLYYPFHCTHIHTHIFPHSHTHPSTHTHTHIHTHTHTHSHTGMHEPVFTQVTAPTPSAFALQTSPHPPPQSPLSLSRRGSIRSQNSIASPPASLVDPPAHSLHRYKDYTGTLPVVCCLMLFDDVCCLMFFVV